MAVGMRYFKGDADFEAIGDFLAKHYQPMNRDGNWFRAIWEYSYFHGWTDRASFDRIGIWEDNGEIVGATIYDMYRTDLSLNVHPEYRHLKKEMLHHAEENLSDTDSNGNRYVKIFVNDFDNQLENLVRTSGYQWDRNSNRPMSQFRVPSRFPPVKLPKGFELKSLAEDNNLEKIHRVLHRGFNHPGEPPEEEIAVTKRMQSAPHFRHDLTVVVEAPIGDFVTYCGMWYDPENHFGYVEPVATDPDYRRQGLGSATVLESMRRCAQEGADVMYVWTARPFYLSLGFEKLYTQNCWMKKFSRPQGKA